MVCRPPLLFFLSCHLVNLVRTLSNGLALTPAMGWNSWNPFRCEGLNEALIREVADAIVSTGLRDMGYRYVNIDDCWMAPQRGEDGHLRSHPQRFPSGMKALGDYIHARGLKFGIYSCAGHVTCEGWPASFGHERIDAADWASWGVDYLKYDFCGLEKVDTSQKDPRRLYSVMRDALNATGRPILFSLCNWGVGQPHRWGHDVANSWRTGRDVFAVWDEHAARRVHKLPGYLQSIMTAIEDADRAQRVVDGPGGFNDPDMLVVGLEGMTPYGIVDECPGHLPAGSCKPGAYISRQQWGMVGGLTYTEQRTHFAFWCMLSSPLMLGNDPRHMSAATRRILSSTGLLRINQDPLGHSARKVLQEGAAQIWRKQLADGSHALLLFNSGDDTIDITTRWRRDLPEVAWQKHERDVAREPPCADATETKTCASWAKSGECEKNPGFMHSSCMKACDKCPPPLWEGRQAVARVLNAWEADELEGEFIKFYTAKHVERREARVILVTFGEEDAAVAAAAVAVAKGDVDEKGGGAAGHSRAHLRHGLLGEAAARRVMHAREAAAADGDYVSPSLGGCTQQYGLSLLGVALLVVIAVGCGATICQRAGGGRRSKPLQHAGGVRPHAV